MSANSTAAASAPNSDESLGICDPPTTWWSALRMIGPGIVLAGTIVGSGEFLLTTKLGAEHGMTFLWLILLSCVIKVFVQIELGRYAISSGQPTLSALDTLPGPRWGANVWVWWWFLMMLATMFQLGAMTGTVGQSLYQAFPQTSAETNAQLAQNWPSVAEALTRRPEMPWAFVTCAAALAVLATGTYRNLERITTVLVVGATLLTVAATACLPWTNYPLTWSSIASGLTFQLPAMDGAAVATALGVFGVTGVGATELFYYPYWCIEKGYARFVGPYDASPAWHRRAQGWIRVMYLDAWVSMVVFTVSTVAFYCMGAAVLHPQGLVPAGPEMIRTLSRMFVDSIGDWTRIVFLVGAGTVLFKTLYLASAGNARLAADFLRVVGWQTDARPAARARCVMSFSMFFPILALGLFLGFVDPSMMTAIGGFAQAVTLPMIAITALVFRYRRTLPNLAPGRLWDAMLWVAVVAITVVATWAATSTLVSLVQPSP